MSARLSAKPLRDSYPEISPDSWRIRNRCLAVGQSVLSMLGGMHLDQVGTAAAAAPGVQMRSLPKNQSVGRPRTDAAL